MTQFFKGRKKIIKNNGTTVSSAISNGFFFPEKPKTWHWILAPLLILLGGLVIVLAARIWDPLWNPFRPRPEKVLERMILKMKELKTVESENKISLAVQSNDGSNFEMEIKLSEKEDLREKENPKSEGDFYFSFGAGASKTKETPSFAMGGKVSLAGQYKNLNQKGFVKLTTLPADFWLSSFLPQLFIKKPMDKNRQRIFVRTGRFFC